MRLFRIGICQVIRSSVLDATTDTNYLRLAALALGLAAPGLVHRDSVYLLEGTVSDEPNDHNRRHTNCILGVRMGWSQVVRCRWLPLTPLLYTVRKATGLVAVESAPRTIMRQRR